MAPKKEAGEGGKSAGKGLQKPLTISKELADFLGTSEITRPELTKKMWEYFKKNSLIDPENKKMVKCDAKLKALTGQDSFLAFGFAKHIKKHIQ